MKLSYKQSNRTAEQPNTIIVQYILLCCSMSWVNLCLIYCCRIEEKEEIKENVKTFGNMKELKVVHTLRIHTIKKESSIIYLFNVLYCDVGCFKQFWT